jgi:phosphoribosylformimino-5-aminoimidazole carboxamide ribotide isomerase
VASLDDVLGARAAGAGGAILGKALLDGRFTMVDALAALDAAEGRPQETA